LFKDIKVTITRTSASPVYYNTIDPSIVWDFNDLKGRKDASVGLQNYWVVGGNLTIFTNPNLGKNKIKTLSTFNRNLQLGCLLLKWELEI
jgi:hypothetical protein